MLSTRQMVRVRKAIESQYDRSADVIEYQSYKDPANKQTTKREVTVLEDQPCKVIFKTLSQAHESSTAATAPQTIKLLIAPEPNIKPGSKIVITRKGITTEYKGSGVPAMYDTHQEILLDIFKGWT